MKIIGNRVISIAECLFIDKQDSSVIVIHARQHEAGQENAVFNAIERHEKRYGFVHVLSDMLKPTMSIDAPAPWELWSGLFHWRKAYQQTS